MTKLIIFIGYFVKVVIAYCNHSVTLLSEILSYESMDIVEQQFCLTALQIATSHKLDFCMSVFTCHNLLKAMHTTSA